MSNLGKQPAVDPDEDVDDLDGMADAIVVRCALSHSKLLQMCSIL